MRGHFSKDVSQLKVCLDWVDLDLVLNDLLANPNGFDSVVLAARSELRRWSSPKNQSARVVLVDGDMHNARVSIRVVIRFLYPNGNSNFINEGNDRE